MINKLIYKEAYSKVAKELGLSEKIIEQVYRSFWAYIKDTVTTLPLEGLSEEEFNSIKTSFNIPRLGKLFVKYNKLKQIQNVRRNKHKENKTHVHSSCDNNGEV